MTRLALQMLQASEEPGILFISAGMALAAAPNAPAYAATKAAVHSVARSLRADDNRRRWALAS
jgi:short-subunit dehydrogenase involved in D-alanine esterification of teichoic acids